MIPADVRDRLIAALRTDLVGPALPDEILNETPTRWYLTGFLAPLNAGVEQRSDPEAEDEFDQLEPASSAAEDNANPERVTARHSLFPASLGLSVLVSADTPHLTVQLDWGDYQRLAAPPVPAAPTEDDQTLPTIETWQRHPRHPAPIPLTLPAQGHLSRHSQPVPDDPRLKLTYSVRALPTGIDDRLPPGARIVSIFLSNERGDAPTAERRDEHYVFQPAITVTSPRPFLPQPNLRGRDPHDDWDERIADLHYRDVHAYAVGHGVATEAILDPEGACLTVRTAWIPHAAVEFVAPSKRSAVELRMEVLAALPDAAAAQTALQPLLTDYRAWIAHQHTQLPTLCAAQQPIAQELLNRATQAADRIEAGLHALQDPQVFTAFGLTQRVMARAARQRDAQQHIQRDPEWRPFQLAFLLLNLRGLSEPDDYDRGVVDLLFFPTGGGKTEAYLGLAAFTLILRRLRNPGIQSAGLTVLMRYTLRLLTLDQLGRATALICALELEREADPTTLGAWPFEIGLWVGQAATPNRMGSSNDDNDHPARHDRLWRLYFTGNHPPASPMPDRFLSDDGRYLLRKGLRPETRRVFFELPIAPATGGIVSPCAARATWKPGSVWGVRYPRASPSQSGAVLPRPGEKPGSGS